MIEPQVRVPEADRLSKRILILSSETDTDRINRYCNATDKRASRGEVLRRIIMQKVEQWEKRQRSN